MEFLPIAATIIAALFSIWHKSIFKEKKNDAEEKKGQKQKKWVSNCISSLLVLLVAWTTYHQSNEEKKKADIKLIQERYRDSVMHVMETDSLHHVIELTKRTIEFQYTTEKNRGNATVSKLDAELFYTFGTIDNLANSIYFSNLDSAKLLEQLQHIVLETLKLLKAIRNNEVLRSNPVALKHYNYLDSAVSNHILPLNGYGNGTVIDMRDELAEVLKKNGYFIFLYSTTKKTFLYDRRDKIIEKELR